MKRPDLRPGKSPDAGMRRLYTLLALGILVIVTWSALPQWTGLQVAGAQEDEPPLRLRLRRDFGYGSGAQIQGRFSLIVDSDESVEGVVFFVDDEQIGEDGEAPFRLQFNTGAHELGWHSLHAVGYAADGRELASNVVQRQFVSGSTSTIIIVAALALILGFRVISHLVTRDKSGQKKGYGMYGGAVCKQCGRPFSRHWWGFNLLVGKLERCPHCGKWQFTTRATPQMLESAERFAEELDGQAEPEIDEGDEEALLRRRIEESRFEE